MVDRKKVVQCLPNFSEGRDLFKIEKIVNVFRRREGVKLIDYDNHVDFNRTIVVLIGEPYRVMDAVLEAIGVAIENIDMRLHKGQHPRIGAVDVVPFIPLKNISMLETVQLSREFGKEAGEKYKVPIFLYEKSASRPERENLANIRRGQYEGMMEKIKRIEWKPDFGPSELNITAGATAVGARMPLIAFNIMLNTKDKAIADNISRNIRCSGGGLRFCKAISVKNYSKEFMYISINMTDYNKTSLYTVFEMVKGEAKRFGVSIVSSEIVGTVPMQALIDTSLYYLQLDNFSMEQILENTIME